MTRPTCLTARRSCATRRCFIRLRTFEHSPRHSIYPANYEPSTAHYFVRQLERQSQLQRMYSQNIDTLEQKAGIERVIQCHGSFASATCTDPRCGYRADGASIKDAILAKRVPSCPRCAARDERRAAKRRKQSAGFVDGDDDSHDDGLAYGIMKVRAAPDAARHYVFWRKGAWATDAAVRRV